MSGLLFNIFAVLPPWGPQNFSLRPSASSLVLDGKWCFPIPHSLDVLPPKFTLQVLTLHSLTTCQHYPKGRRLWNEQLDKLDGLCASRCSKPKWKCGTCGPNLLFEGGGQNKEKGIFSPILFLPPQTFNWA